MPESELPAHAIESPHHPSDGDPPRHSAPPAGQDDDAIPDDELGAISGGSFSNLAGGYQGEYGRRPRPGFRARPTHEPLPDLDTLEW